MPRVERNTFIGIDPGKSGGMIALVGDAILYETMPDTDRGVANWLSLVSTVGRSIAAIEKVSGFVGKKQPGSAMFNFGVGYGGLKMALACLEIPFEEVTPQRWQKDMQCRTGGDKLVSLRRAQQLYPKLPLWKEPRSKGKQLAIADALLLATYCKRKHEGTL